MQKAATIVGRPRRLPLQQLLLPVVLLQSREDRAAMRSAAPTMQSYAAGPRDVEPPVLCGRERKAARDGAGEDATHDALGGGQARIVLETEASLLALHMLQLPPLHASSLHETRPLRCPGCCRLHMNLGARVYPTGHSLLPSLVRT